MPVAEEVAKSVECYLEEIGGVDEAAMAGSYRRRQEMVGDLDVMVSSEKSKKVIDRLSSSRCGWSFVKLTFLGARGELEAKTQRHHMHSSLMVSYYDKRVMVDCGADWLGRIDGLEPEAIVVTHAHPDHAWGLKEGAPCPVYAPKEAWRFMEDHGVRDRRLVEHRAATEIRGMVFKVFPVEHSIRAPVVGYRISAGRAIIFYAPDVVYVRDRERALTGAKLYVVDGATVTRSWCESGTES